MESSLVPVWQRPARLAARWHRGIRPFLETDLLVINRLRVPHSLIVGICVVVTAVPSFFHAIAGFGANVFYSLVDVAVQNVYTESLPFMAAALLIGMLAPTAGAGLVAIFIPLDLIASALQQQELTPFAPAVAGRAVSYWLLWLLAVEIPILVRTALDALDRPQATSRGWAIAVAVVAGGVLPWIWSHAVTMLIRPVFTWSDLFSPYYNAVAPVQEAGEVLGLIGAVGAAGAGWLHLRFAAGGGLPLFSEELPSARKRVGVVPLTVLLTLALFGGMITTLLDVVLLVVVLLTAQPIGLALRRRTGLWDRLAKVPWVLRFAVAFGLAYLGASVVVVPLFRTTFGSEFLPIVLAQGVVMIIYEFFIGEEKPGRPPVQPAPAVTGLLIAGTFLFVLLIPNAALADNCSSRTDCYPAPWPAAAGAAGAGGAAMMNKHKNTPKDKDPIAKARKATDLLSKAPGTKQLSIQKNLVGRLLAWMFDSSNKISEQLGNDPPRADFTEIAEASPLSTPAVPYGEILGAEMSTAVAAAWQAHLDYLAHGQAAVVSFDRYGGAKAAKDQAWMAKQAAAVVRHKKAMAPALRQTSDAIERVWQLADKFNPSGSIPSEAFERLAVEETNFARTAGLGDADIAERQAAVGEGRGLPDDEDVARITRAYRSMADAFDRLPTL